MAQSGSGAPGVAAVLGAAIRGFRSSPALVGEAFPARMYACRGGEEELLPRSSALSHRLPHAVPGFHGAHGCAGIGGFALLFGYDRAARARRGIVRSGGGE